VTPAVATDSTGGTTMGLDDKIGNKGDELKAAPHQPKHLDS
jgi:hypothetical protein